MYSILTVVLVDLVIVTRVMATGVKVVVKKVNIIVSLLAWEQVMSVSTNTQK